jgi:hypothetical protein
LHSNHYFYVDEEPPLISCPPAAAIPFGTPPTPSETGNPTVSDNCTPQGQISVNFSDQTTGTGCAQVITRTWTATDQAGNAASCTQTITFVDEEPPLISCPPAAAIPFGTPPTPSETGNPTVSDNCTPQGQISVNFSDQTTGTGCAQVITRTWTATDQSGNAASCTQAITFVDHYFYDEEPPLISCPPAIDISCGSSTDPATTGFPELSDNCTPADQLSLSFEDQGGGTGCEQTISRLWTAVDAVGNASSCIQLITITDTDPPLITCPPDISVNCGDENDLSITGQAVATDPCGSPVSIVFADDLSGCAVTITRTWTATDACSNAASCAQSITTIPEVTCVFFPTFSVLPATCGQFDGAISVSIDFPPGTYTLIWSNGATGFEVTGLSAGDYSTSITHVENNCTLEFTVEVPENPAYQLIELETSHPTGPTAMDGAVVMVVDPLTALLPMHVFVNGVFHSIAGAHIFVVENLGVGSYEFMIVEAAGTGCASSPLVVSLMFNPVTGPEEGLSLQWQPVVQGQWLPGWQERMNGMLERLPQTVAGFLPEHPRLQVAPAPEWLLDVPASIAVGVQPRPNWLLWVQSQTARGQAIYNLSENGANAGQVRVPFRVTDHRMGLRFFGKPEGSTPYLGIGGQWQRLAVRSGSMVLAGQQWSIPAAGTQDVWTGFLEIGWRIKVGENACFDWSIACYDSPLPGREGSWVSLRPNLALRLPLR